MEFLHHGVSSKSFLDRIDDAREIPELTLWARIEGLPYGVGILGRFEIGE